MLDLLADDPKAIRSHS